MLYNMLIGTFQEGGYLLGVIFWVVFIGISFVLLFLLIVGYEEVQWSRTTPFEYECTLLNQSYSESTLKNNVVPVVTSNGGVGVGVVQSGNSESYTTVWDCGKYGKIVSTEKEVFRLAQDRSVLLLKERRGEVRIVGILQKM